MITAARILFTACGAYLLARDASFRRVFGWVIPGSRRLLDRVMPIEPVVAGHDVDEWRVPNTTGRAGQDVVVP